MRAVRRGRTSEDCGHALRPQGRTRGVAVLARGLVRTGEAVLLCRPRHDREPAGAGNACAKASSWRAASSTPRSTPSSRWTSSGIIPDWNSQAEKIFGWSRDEAVGTKLSELIVPDVHRDAHQPAWSASCAPAKATILGRRFEIEAMRRDGKEIKVELSVTELKTPQRLRVQRLHPRPHRQDRGRGPDPAGREDGSRRPAHRRHRA